MRSYTVTVLPKAVRILSKLPREIQQRIARRIDALAFDPRPPGSEPVRPTAFLRIRVGNYRVIYGVDDNAITVTVVVIGHRR